MISSLILSATGGGCLTPLAGSPPWPATAMTVTLMPINRQTETRTGNIDDAPKSETRNPKSETNPNIEYRNPKQIRISKQKTKAALFWVVCFGYRVCFGFRISSFGFLHCTGQWPSRQDIHPPGAALDAETLPGAQPPMHLRQTGDGGQAELARHDRPGRQDAAGLHHQAAGVDEQRHPRRVGGRADENVRLVRHLRLCWRSEEHTSELQSR